MDLSICIVSWNVRELLRECLESIRRAETALEVEVLVVDNNSRDDSPGLVRNEFPEVTLISNRVNRGFAYACNQGIRKSRGRYILLLNPDTIIRIGSLEEMVRFLDEEPTAGGAGPKLINPDGTLQPSVRAYPGFRSSLRQFTLLGDLGIFHKAGDDYLEKGFDYGSPSVVKQPMGAALFLRRKALDEVGLLDEKFFLYYEEVDLCLRLAQSGRALWYNPRAVITHLGGASTAKAGARSDFWLMRSQFYYFRKHRGKLKTFFFSLIFKPMFMAGLLGGTIENGVSLLSARITGADEEIILKKETRFRRKVHFLNRYSLKFIFL